MDHISTILPRILQRHGIKADADASLVLAKANTWLEGRLGALAEEAEVTTLDTGVLTIAVRGSIASQECFALHRDLVEFLGKEVPGVRVERVRIVRKRDMEMSTR